MSVQAAPASGLAPRRFERREILLWSAAAIVALVAHVGTGWQAYRWGNDQPPPAEAAPAIMIDLAPMSVAAESVPMDTPDTVDSVDAPAADDPVEVAEAVPVTDAKVEQVEEFEEVDPLQETVVEEITPETAQPIDPNRTEQAQVETAVPEEVTETSEVVPETVEPTAEPTTAEAEEVIPDIVEAPLPEVAVAVPEPRPVEEEAEPKPPAAERKPVQEPKPVAKAKPVEKAKPAEKPKEVVKAPPKKKPSPKADVARTKSGQNAPKASASAGNQGSKGSTMSPATWKSRVYAHIARGKRSLKGRRGSEVVVRFSFDNSGNVLSASVVGSSGDPKLEQSAVAMVLRRSPIPAPPAGVSRTLTAPMNLE
jgi:protein TonB